MSETSALGPVGRRHFFKLAGGAAALSVGLGVTWKGRTLSPLASSAADAAPREPDLWLGGTDGWISLPPTPQIGHFHPDPYAAAAAGDSGNPARPYTTYIFGFRNITGLDAVQQTKQKNHAQHQAPLFWTTVGQDFRVKISNLGLKQRPDLFDAHTLHWHGFRNVIPFFDGEPSGSVSVPAGAQFTYVYKPHEPGTYMYHCHVEDTEHVHMGMTGLVFVRPESTVGQDKSKWCYDDPSTAFNREYAMFLSEIWAEAHWADAHIQLPEWSDYHPDFSMLNGRVYPDTIAPNGSIDPFHPVRNIDGSGDLVAPDGHPHLKYQPMSSLVECNEGEKVLLRFANLGFKEAAMTTAGIKMRVIGRDATPMRGRNSGTPGAPVAVAANGMYPLTGADTSYETNTITIGAGESYDVLLDVPAYKGGDSGNVYDTYLIYNRNYTRTANLAEGGYGGQTTEIRVYPATGPDARGIQLIPNT
jgi:FtsP/CotA-like multicopper oxidase with cupredoxin domain